MKSATLLAIIAIVVQLIASSYYLLLMYDLVPHTMLIQRAIQPLFLLSGIGLLIFFIQFYQKQPND